MSEEEETEPLEVAVPVFFIPFVPVATEIFLIIDDLLADVPGFPFQGGHGLGPHIYLEEQKKRLLSLPMRYGEYPIRSESTGFLALAFVGWRLKYQRDIIVVPFQKGGVGRQKLYGKLGNDVLDLDEMNPEPVGQELVLHTSDLVSIYLMDRHSTEYRIVIADPVGAFLCQGYHFFRSAPPMTHSTGSRDNDPGFFQLSETPSHHLSALVLNCRDLACRKYPVLCDCGKELAVILVQFDGHLVSPPGFDVGFGFSVCTFRVDVN